MKQNEWEIIFNSISDPVMILSPDFRILAVNRAMTNISGLTHEQLIGGHCHKIFHNSKSPPDKCPIKTLLSAKKPAFTEAEIDIMDRIFRVAVSPVLDENGQMTKTVHVARDITEQKKMEAALWESKERFRTMVEQSPVSVQIMEPGGRTIIVNNAWEKLWGVELEDLDGYNILKDKQLEQLGIMPYIKKGFSGETAFIPAAKYDAEKTLGKGQARWVQAHIYPVKDEQGSIRMVVLMHEDITERKIAEEEIKHRVKELEDFYTMSIGRELKMKQLKKEIEELKTKLSKQKK